MLLSDTPATPLADKAAGSLASRTVHGSMQQGVSTHQHPQSGTHEVSAHQHPESDPQGGFDRQAGADDDEDPPSPSPATSRHLPLSGSTLAAYDSPVSGISSGPLSAASQPPVSVAALHQSCVFPLRLGRGGNDRDAHWRVRSHRARVTREVVGYELFKAHFVRPFPSQYPITVSLGRNGPSRGLDGDNLQGSLKVVRDAVADFLQRDDSDPSIRWAYTQCRMPAWEVSIDITVDLP
jgi:hypothetical protein